MYNNIFRLMKNFFYFFFYKFHSITVNLSDVKLCWYAIFFTFLNEFYFIYSVTWLEPDSSFIFPEGVNPALVCIFVTWILTWSISGLRRTLFGRFTRGDRKLWYKGFVSFWVVELVTIAGLYISACWMSWGPAPMIHRNFLIPERGFIIELAFFTIIIWVLYLLRFFIKWNSWKTSSILTIFIIIITAFLIWRDLIIFWGRETMSVNNGSRWRYIDCHILKYSLCPEWWVSFYIGNEKFVSSGLTLNEFLTFYDTTHSHTEYEKYNLMVNPSFDEWIKNSMPFSSLIDSVSIRNNFIVNSVFAGSDNFGFDYFNRSVNNTIIYPRRIGFSTKKLAMWTLLMVLKIWHHVILFYWWFIFLLRLHGTHKNAYALLATCKFNVYCCFIIGLLVYMFYLLPFYENFLRLKPLKIRGYLYRKSTYLDSINYVYSLFTLEDMPFKVTAKRGKLSFYRLTKSVNISYLNDFMFKLEFASFDCESMDLNFKFDHNFWLFEPYFDISEENSKPVLRYFMKSTDGSGKISVDYSKYVDYNNSAIYSDNSITYPDGTVINFDETITDSTSLTEESNTVNVVEEPSTLPAWFILESSMDPYDHLNC